MVYTERAVLDPRQNELGEACNKNKRKKNVCRILVREKEGRNHLRDQGVKGTIG